MGEIENGSKLTNAGAFYEKQAELQASTIFSITNSDDDSDSESDDKSDA